MKLLFKIRNFWNDISILLKTFVSFLSVFLVCVVLIIIWSAVQNKERELERYTAMLENAESAVNKCAFYANNFLLIDLSNERFYESQSSKNIQQFEKQFEVLKTQVTDLDESYLSVDYVLQVELTEIEDKVGILKSTFELLIEKSLERGFYNYGIEGAFRDKIHIIEDSYSDVVSPEDMLILRRHEKDYLLRNDDKYVVLFDLKIKQLLQNKKPRLQRIMEAERLLSEYHHLFFELYEVNNLLFDNEEGIKQELIVLTDNVINQIYDLHQKVDGLVDKSTARIRTVGMILIGSLVLLTLIMVYFLSKGLTYPIGKLSAGINSFVESGFKSKVYVGSRKRKDELGLLVNNFYKLQGEIAVTFKEYREEAEYKHQKLLRQNERIEIQKNLLKEHRGLLKETNDRIQESLNYAKRIQKNLMPSKEEVKRSIKDYEIWYRPKDTVSGDFCWYTETEDYLFFALADCTGHGVPGAFLSIMGMGALDLAIKQKNLDMPSEVLSFMNEQMIGVLKNDDRNFGLRDSIDVVLMRVDKRRKQAVISSANKDYVIVKNGAPERLKPSKCSVGSSELYNYFGNIYDDEAYDLEEISAVYFYSDGIVDQFGERTNKKFKFKRLFHTLSKNQGIAVSIQEIKHDVLAWKGENEQTDDITIVGFGFEEFKPKRMPVLKKSAVKEKEVV